jgi:C-terminal processing protease CtpA/Prc
LLGEAGLGSFVTAGNAGAPWHARDPVDVEPTPRLAELKSAYVAVITGPRTFSSGEAVTVAFRERPRTRSFGLPTGGLSTTNAGFPLPDGSAIYLTVAVDADRTGQTSLRRENRSRRSGECRRGWTG